LTTLVKEAATGGRNLALKFPPGVKVVLLVSGTERQVQQQQALLAGNSLPSDIAPVQFVPIGLHKRFNFFAQEGLFLLQSRMRKPHTAPELWIFTVEVDDLADPAFLDGLFRLREMAKLANFWIVPIIECEEKKPSDLGNFVDEFAVVSPCEPDVDGGVAFAFDCQSYEGLTSFGLGKVMCTVKYGQDFRYERTFAPFVAKSLRNRAIRILASNGYSGTEIAEIVDRNKSNVSRQLEGWQPRRVEMAEGWIDRLREHFATDGKPPKAKDKVSVTTAAEIRADHDEAQRRMDEDEDF
jgi:hypothetical protein